MKEIKLSAISVKNKKNENEESEDEENKKEKKEKTNKNNNNIDNLIPGLHQDKKNNQNVTQISSADEAKFNRLKSNIVENYDTFIIFYMKILNLLFVALTIFFVIYDTIINTNNIEKMDKFLKENLVFNHTKMSSGRIYLETILYRYLREGFITNDNCLVLPCKYISILGYKEGVNDLQSQKPLFTTFSKEEDIFNSIVKSMGEVKIYNKNKTDIIQCNMEFTINLIIDSSLKLMDYDSKLPEEFEDVVEYVRTSEFNETRKEIVQYINISLINLLIFKKK